LQFLKHLARTKLLMHLVDIKPYESMDSPVVSAKKIIAEVEKWSDRNVIISNIKVRVPSDFNADI
jgi:GTPase involved in cell partitioning and DNA repair